MPDTTFTTILRKLVILALFIYFATRVYVAYSKLDAGKIGTLFNRITETTVLVNNLINISLLRLEINYLYSFVHFRKKLVNAANDYC